MQSQLSARESVTDTLRAQTHEFSNQLHTISGLLQLEEYDEAGRVIGALTRRRAEISDAVTARVDDPSVAALLIAKASLAAERGIDLAARRRQRAAAARPRALGRCRHRARQPGRQRRRRRGRRRRHRGSTSTSRWTATPCCVQVADSGPGRTSRTPRSFGAATPPSRATRAAAASAWRWCRSSASAAGGSVSVHNADGAVFTARLPRHPGAS